MKYFLKQLGIFVLVLSSSMLLLNRLVTITGRQYWGNPGYSAKHRFFVQNRDAYNAIVLGSSHTHRHVSSNILDATLDSCELSTFNMGINGLYSPESYYLYETLLNDLGSNSVEYAFIELTEMYDIESERLGVPRIYYWQNFDYLSLLLRYALAADMQLGKKGKFIGMYAISYVHKTFLGFRAFFEDLPNDIAATEKEEDGFYPFETQMNDPNTDPKTRSSLRETMSAFFENPDVLEGRVVAAQTGKNRTNFSPNPIQLKKALDLIDTSKERGIHLVFFVAPRKHDYVEILNIADSLPDEHVVEVFDPAKYPDLYVSELSFDVGHLNTAGAEIFTQYLANAIRPICNHRTTEK